MAGHEPKSWNPTFTYEGYNSTSITVNNADLLLPYKRIMAILKENGRQVRFEVPSTGHYFEAPFFEEIVEHGGIRTRTISYTWPQISPVLPPSFEMPPFYTSPDGIARIVAGCGIVQETLDTRGAVVSSTQTSMSCEAQRARYDRAIKEFFANTDGQALLDDLQHGAVLEINNDNEDGYGLPAGPSSILYTDNNLAGEVSRILRRPSPQISVLQK